MNLFPANWSLDQVIAVDQFLVHLRDQLWCQYRHDLRPLFSDDGGQPASANRSDTPRQHPLFDDSDLPF